MKKMIAAILCIVLTFALIGCGSKATESVKEESSISTGGSLSKSGSKAEETVSEETPIEVNPFTLIAGEYHLSGMIQDDKDYYDLLKDFIASGDFDEWVIITEEGNLTMYSLNRLGEDQEDAGPQVIGDYNITYDPDTNEIVVTDFSATDETIICDGTVLTMDSPTYHLEFSRS